MLNYYVLEIAGKQYLVESNKGVRVDFLGEAKEFKCDRVLMKSTDGKVEFGTPYLEDGVLLEVNGQVRKKVKVATYKAKANYRRVIGSKARMSVIRLKDASVKKS